MTPDLLPNPLAPIAFPANFPDEWFYWLASTKMTLPNGGLALLVMVVEGSFVNGVVVPGDQTVFSRVRIRPAVALVRDNQCSACHVTVTSSGMQILRKGDALVQCENCGRILVRP